MDYKILSQDLIHKGKFFQQHWQQSFHLKQKKPLSLSFSYFDFLCVFKLEKLVKSIKHLFSRIQPEVCQIQILILKYFSLKDCLSQSAVYLVYVTKIIFIILCWITLMIQQALLPLFQMPLERPQRQHMKREIFLHCFLPVTKHEMFT